ncbi:MAG: hypothetical protein LQ352_000293 [Teloschistes flavicans]|nr:MAG: hypothetical protein LQ352_000293 [Teloschistes flavicans]
MPPSQLKKLKSSLREQGITGVQKSKKQKRQASKNGAFRDARLQRSAALQSIREQFNPFEVRASTGASKYHVASNKPTVRNVAIARPGVTKGLGEEKRRQTLLKEMHRRKKVGGILDRRFGENDPTMTLEEKALERFVKEKQRGGRRDTLFDLEDGDEDNQLTHFGQSLSFEKPSATSDFNGVNLTSEEGSMTSEDEARPSKRRRLSEDGDESQEALLDEDKDGFARTRKKSKKEVMEEVIAKSKLHKYERQQAKEDDDDLRAELDKGLPDLLAIMSGTQPKSPPQQASKAPNGNMNPDRAALLSGKDRAQIEKEYDERLRQMTFDQRSKPSERTLTEEEKLKKEARRLGELEQQRLYRMRGEPANEEEVEDADATGNEGNGGRDQDEEDPYGLGLGLAGQTKEPRLDVEDEDDFVIEDNLAASDPDPALSGESTDSSSEGEDIDEDEREFVQGLLTEQDVGRDLSDTQKRDISAATNTRSKELAYIYKCPQSLEEMIELTQDVPVIEQPTIIQRIRALYHPKLQAGNKEKLEVFSAVLVDHIFHLANRSQKASFAGLEAVIRHVHSLAKMFPEAVGRAFRARLTSFIEDRPLDPNTGDLILLTAIGTIFPTSDHFHPIVTPALLCIGQYLGQKTPRHLSDLATGMYLCTLGIQYQNCSKRHVPELVKYSLNGLYALAPVQPSGLVCKFPLQHLPTGFRVKKEMTDDARRLKISDTIPAREASEGSIEALKQALLHTLICIYRSVADLWAGMSAYPEIMEPIVAGLTHLASKACASKVQNSMRVGAMDTLQYIRILMRQARTDRKPLLLHNHRPLPIKTSIPKFEESYNPDKHYDRDRDRAEVNKLKAEHKKERKGALRELRKDANFIARESLREKKEKDAQYEKKFKRLVAEIQGEEGREAKSYEREKRMRKGQR